MAVRPTATLPDRDAAAPEAYFRPTTLDDALIALADGPWTPIAGCTDVYPAHVGRQVRGRVLDLTGIVDLRGIRADGDHVRIGALTTWIEIAEAGLPPAFDALRQAARQIGGVQIQNAGTLGGNLCNASPAADGVPPLLILDARVELRSAAGTRLLPLAQFVLGARRTARHADELLTAIVVDRPAGRQASSFLKLGARAYQVISIVMVAARLERDAAGRITDAAVAVGSCSEAAMRLPALEGALAGRPLTGTRLSGLIRQEHLAPLAPISDIRGSAAYRRDAAATLIGRAIDALQDELR
jgi:CO/xanthine dehydrogenase FAD-binding subunit